MAHVLVLLERTPHGLHPAAAVGLCRARDVATEHGATVTALLIGDAGEADVPYARAAGRFGADQLLQTGPHGLKQLAERLQPVHVFVPYTASGLAAARDLPGGAPAPRWVTDVHERTFPGDTVSAVVAGLAPWHELKAELEPEFHADVGSAALPAWARADGAPQFHGIPGGPLVVVGPAAVLTPVVAALASLGALGIATDGDAPWAEHPGLAPLGLTGAGDSGADTPPLGTLVALGSDALQHARVAERSPGVRLVVLAGEGTVAVEPSWLGAEVVLPGPCVEAARELLASPWRQRIG
jgi:hypothetical protein